MHRQRPRRRVSESEREKQEEEEDVVSAFPPLSPVLEQEPAEQSGAGAGAGAGAEQLPLRGLTSYGRTARVLGAGTYGEVRMVCRRRCETGDAVAVKLAKKRDGAIDQSLLIEGAILSTLLHPNVVRLVDIALTGDGTFALVLPIAISTLSDYAGRLPATDIGVIAYQLCRALAFLQSADVWHRDIKPANVLLYRESCSAAGIEASPSRPTAVLTDFGVARFGMCAHPRDLVDENGTVPYAAPEVLLGGRFTFAGDVWSLGCTLYEALTGLVAFGATERHAVLALIFGVFGAPTELTWPGLYDYPHWRAEFAALRGSGQVAGTLDAATRSFVLRMLAINPALRPTADQLVHSLELAPFRDAVEACSPAARTPPVDCEAETALAVSPAHAAPAWLTPRRRFVIVEWLEDLRERVESSLRALFLARELLEAYLATRVDVAEQEEDAELAETAVVCQICVHLASNLVGAASVSVHDVLDTEGDVDAGYFAELELRVLVALRFDVARETVYSVLSTLGRYYSDATLAVATTLLRCAAHSALDATADELARTCVMLGCTSTGEEFRHTAGVDRQRYERLVPEVLRSAGPVLASGRARERLQGSNGTLQQQLLSVPLASTFLPELLHRTRARPTRTASAVARELR
jgi:negative regulator of PHO system